MEGSETHAMSDQLALREETEHVALLKLAFLCLVLAAPFSVM